MRCVPRAYVVNGEVECYVDGHGVEWDEYAEAVERYEDAVDERADELLDRDRDERMEEEDGRGQ